MVARAAGRRTVAAALRILGRDREPDFCTFHRILNRAAWSSRAAAGRLLVVLVRSLVPAHGPVVIGLDDTIERRWGTKISARGIYRDPVRSSFQRKNRGCEGRGQPRRQREGPRGSGR
ncbi:transposase [Bradyrhizobium sp. USDA 10063]